MIHEKHEKCQTSCDGVNKQGKSQFSNQITHPHEILINCIVNRSSAFKHPKAKKYDTKSYHAHKNYTREQIPLESVCEETLLKGFQLIPGEFSHNPKIGLRKGDNWKSQQLFLIDFDNTTEETLKKFIKARPFLQENAWLLTESLRSRYDDPHDATCNGQLRLRIAFCMPRPVTSVEEREWVYTALVKELPGCDDKSANSITNGGLGNANATSVKIGKIVGTDWFESALRTGKQAKQKEQKEKQREAAERKRRQAERAAMGFTAREGELPLQALAKADPSLFLESLGLSPKSESGQYQHWGRTEKPGDTALSVWQSAQGNWQIRVFANSIPVPPSVSDAMPFPRFYCYHELNIDNEGLQPDSQQWKDLNAELARRGYGTWLSDEEFHAKHATPTKPRITSSDRRGLELLTTLPPDHPILTSAPPIEVRETPSYRHFSKEEREVVSNVLSLNPDAGWHGQTPIFTTRYEYLHPLTEKFKLNGQPSEVEKRRVWSTRFGSCEKCGAVTAEWIDRYLLTAGYYCDGCRKDYPLGSYLELELARKLPNSIISGYQGFLGNDPEFEDFRLWQPEMLTHLCAAMFTGKPTEIYKALVSLAMQNLGRGIIVSPRISLTRFLAHQLRIRYGRRAWGMWHEGSGSREQFIGTYGAIVCLPSLSRAVKAAYHEGLDASSIYLAIDELDFSYNLLSLTVHQAAAVKKCLLDIFIATGLVVSGQTESTLALEAFASELGCENLQGFYNTAPPTDSIVEMRKYPAVEGKNALVLAGAIESIAAFLIDGHNVYVFCSSRRDSDVIAERFSTYAPICYNAYTKGDARCDAVLKNQRLPDGSRLFIGTSAAGVGISIWDPKAKTVIVAGLNHGSRGTSMLVQKAVRDRGRRGVELHHTDYNSALPMRPRETERVSLYHEEVKQFENRYAHFSENAVKKVARSLALSTLADHQFGAFVNYHLGEVGNMQVVETQALLPEDTKVEWVIEHRRESIKNERESKCKLAVNILRNRDLYTTHEIRVESNRGSFTQVEQIAHEYTNGLACAVGWNDATEESLDENDIDVAVQMAQQNMQPDRLEKVRRGYLAVHYPKWVTAQFQKEIEETHSNALSTGERRELTTITDDRFLGEVLKTLLDRLKVEVFDSDASLASAVREVLDTVSHGQTLFGRIKQGGLGVQAYRRARFLKIADDAFVIHWTQTFIKEFYPATLAKRRDSYVLVHDRRIELILASIKCWLSRRTIGEVPELEKGFEQVDPQVELKEKVRKRREAGALLEKIAAEFDVSVGIVSEWCKDIEVAKKTVREKRAKRRAEKEAEDAQLRVRAEQFRDEGLSLRKIASKLKISYNRLKRLLEAEVHGK